MNEILRAGLTLVIALLGGCAQMNWERSIYEGVRQSAKQQAQRPGPLTLPDPQLPDAARYEQERARLQTQDPASRGM
jgi:hypothetical protein